MSNFTLIKKNPAPGEVTSSLTNAADGGLHFDGAAGYVSCGDSTILDGATKLSIEVIISTTSTTEGRIIAKQFDAIAYALRNDAAGTLTASIGNGSSNVNVSTSGTYNDGKPHHVVVTWDNATIKIYVDGTQDGSGTLAGGSIQNTSDFLEIGARAKSGSRNSFFNGTVSRARLHNRVIDAKTAFENQNLEFSEMWASQTSLVDAAASVFTSGTYGWVKYGNNGLTNTSNQLVITYSDHANGAYNYLKDSTDLTSNLTVGKKYRVQIDAQYAGGSAGVIVQVFDGAAYVDGSALTTSMTTQYIEFTAQHATNAFVRLSGLAASNVVTLDNFYVYQIGAVSSFELQAANPTQSLMVQDSSGAADGTCSASGISQINGITQLNSTSARIGSTGGPETPADGELIASKVNVTTSGNGEVIVGRDSGASILCQAQASAGRIGTSSNHELQFTANNTVYARIKNNGLFGVNQGAPVQQMHVTGNGSGSTAIDSHGYGLRVSDENHAHGAVDIVSSADTAQFIARSNVQGGFSFKSYASVGTSLVERVSIDASGNVYVASGKFGVGNAATSTPSHLLTVQDSGATGLVKIYSTTGTVTDGQKILEIRADDDANPVAYDLLNVAQGDKERLVVTGEGDTTIKRWTAGNGTGANTVLTLAVDDQPTGVNMSAGDGTRLLFKVPAADANKVGASIDAIRSVDTDADSSTDLRFMVSQNDETLDTAMTISSAGNVYVAGKMGIGDSSPDTEGLEIASPSADTSFDLNSQSDNLLVLKNSDSGSANTGRFAGLQMKINSNSNAAEGTIRTEFSGDGNSSLFFSTTASGAGADRVSIDTSGNLAVGSGGDIGGSGVAKFTAAERIEMRAAGAESPMFLASCYSATSSRCANIAFKKSHTNTGGVLESTLDGENLGKIIWKGVSSGDGERDSASIEGVCDGSPDGSDQPAKLVFKTSSTSETLGTRLTIGPTGLATFSNGIAVNDTSGNYGGKIASSSDASGTASLSAVNKATSGTRRLIDFFAGTNTSRIGSIETDGSATAYNTSSDYRLKENLEPLTGALDRIEQLPVYRFNFKSDPEKTVDGFVAHEVAEFVPEAISGTKDGMQTVVVQKAVEAVEYQPAIEAVEYQAATYYEEGDELPEGVQVGDIKTEEIQAVEYQPEIEAVEAQEEVTEEQPLYQGIDQSKLVPLLVAAVKELKAKVEALENA